MKYGIQIEVKHTLEDCVVGVRDRLATSETADDVKADLDTLTLFDLKTGKTIMGTKSAPGKINDNVKAAGDFWKAQGKIDSPVKPMDAVNPDFISSL